MIYSILCLCYLKLGTRVTRGETSALTQLHTVMPNLHFVEKAILIKISFTVVYITLVK